MKQHRNVKHSRGEVPTYEYNMVDNNVLQMLGEIKENLPNDKCYSIVLHESLSVYDFATTNMQLALDIQTIQP